MNKISNKLKRQCDELNGIISSRNLYHRNGGRYINAHIQNGVLAVEHLYTGFNVAYLDGEFQDGYGRAVFLNY